MNQFSVISTDGHQYKVSSGSIIKVESLRGAVGQVIKLKKIMQFNKDGELLLGNFLPGEDVVKCKILEHFRDKKIIVFKKKRRKGYVRKHGHRQNLSVLQVM